jgi:hypothetical protein
VHLPEHADQLVETDPYGVLTYGDAASLPPSVCARLVHSLDRLAKQNPWFRSGNWRALPIGALARPDMVTEFRKVLNDPDAGLGVRSVVVDALSLGTPIPEMLPDLETILSRAASPVIERASALDALRRMSGPGKAAVQRAYRTFGRSLDELQLRVAVIQAYYGDAFNPDDLISFLADCLDVSDYTIQKTLSTLAPLIPDADLPVLLDGIRAPAAGQTARDVSRFYSTILVRAWRDVLAQPF